MQALLLHAPGAALLRAASDTLLPLAQATPSGVPSAYTSEPHRVVSLTLIDSHTDWCPFRL
jgi:hypothetical protein